MKVKISFELDLSCNESLNIETLEDLRESLQNISSLFNRLHLDSLKRICDAHCYEGKHKQVMKEHLLMRSEQDAAVTEQLFNNYTVAGVTDDGHTFESNREIMKIDGIEAVDF
jgi:hypothetical protein